MKKINRPTSFLLAGICAAAVFASQPSIAQNGATNTVDNGNTSTTTRQAKKAELTKLEKNGYKPAYNDPNYPKDIQNAERRAGTAGNPTPRQ